MTESEDDEIIAEVRRIRDAHAASFNYDAASIVADLRRQQTEAGIKTVTLKPSRSQRRTKRSAA